MPWDYRKARHGFYSRFWKDFKIACASAQKLDKIFLRAKITRKIVNFDKDRQVIIFPNGLKLDSPFNLNAIDFKIINLHLEALQLSINP